MENSQILYKFREIDKYAIDILINKRLYLSSWANLNDPHEAEMLVEAEGYNIHANLRRLNEIDTHFFSRGFIDENLMSPKLCSLSSIWSSNLLWSHYTSGHSGMAIGITLPTSERNIRELKVIYDDKVPIIKRTPLNKQDVLKALKHKSREWKYEKEMRLVTFESERRFIENIKISEIIFGLRTSKDDISLIYNMIKNSDIRLYKTCLKPGSYILDKSDISWLK